MSTTEQTTSVTWSTSATSDDAISTKAQINVQNRGTSDRKIIIGVTIFITLSIITGILVIIIVTVIIFKTRGKRFGRYSPVNKRSRSNGTVKTASNGVGKLIYWLSVLCSFSTLIIYVSDNLTYDVGFHSPGTLNSDFILYDDVANSVTVNTGEGNYFELAESGFSNRTYESVTAGVDLYSELSAAHTTDTQVRSEIG